MPENNANHFWNVGDYHGECKSSIFLVDEDGEIITDWLNHQILSNAFQLITNVQPVMGGLILAHHEIEGLLENWQRANRRWIRCLRKANNNQAQSSFRQKIGSCFYTGQSKVALFQFFTGSDAHRMGGFRRRARFALPRRRLKKRETDAVVIVRAQPWSVWNDQWNGAVVVLVDPILI